MSFRNSAVQEQHNIKIEEEGPSQLFLTSNFPHNSMQNAQNQQILSKIAEIIVALHENYLSKCQNLEIYRDLNSQEQELLMRADKNTLLHTVLAGVLAIDSCAKSIEKEEQFVVGNLVRANAGLISTFQQLERELSHSAQRDRIESVRDSIKFVTQQLQTLPASKDREAEIDRQILILDGKAEQLDEEWLKGQKKILLSELQRQNEMLRLAIGQKDSYLKTLEGIMERNTKSQRKQDWKTAHSLRLRMKTQKSSENQTQSQTSLQQVYDELSRIRQELTEKNSIVVKMNEEFASQMQKYNSVFKRLQEENRALKKYIDIDTAYLLEELEMEVDSLREQRHKDQIIIGDIQRKLQGLNFNRDNRQSRLNTEHRNYQQYQSYGEPQFNGYPQQQQPYSPRQAHHFQKQPNPKFPQKFYSPNYSSRVSPYERPPTYREEGYYPPQETLRSRGSKKDEFRKSRGRYQGINSSRERELMQPRSSPTLNLLERVIGKGY